MSVSPTPLAAPDIVAKLRAAGCVFAEDEASLLISSAQTPAHLAAMVEQRTTGLPIEQVIGWTEFCGLRIAVEQGVFVPRHRSELLVREATALARPGAVVVDLCCGSAAVGVAVAAGVEGVKLHAADIDPAAVTCAQRNAKTVGGHVYQGDLFQPLPTTLQNRVDVVVASPPYVPTDAIETLPREARIYEPHLALDGGVDGLDVHRRIAAAVPVWLAPQGHLLIETSERQARETVQIFADNGLVPRVARSDDLDATVVIGAKPMTFPQSRRLG